MLSWRLFAHYAGAIDNLIFPAELARFANDAVSAGRYRDGGDVVLAGVSLLLRSEAEVAAFVASPDEAQAEGERDGFFATHDMHREKTEMLDELDRPCA